METGILETEEDRYIRRHKRYLDARSENKNYVFHKDINGNKVKSNRKKLSELSEEEREKQRERKHRAYLKARELNKSYVNTRKSKDISEEEREKRKLSSAKWKKEHPERVKENRRRWQEEHYEEQKRSWQEYRRNNKKLAVSYLGGHCIRCNGIFHPDVYDFHHKNEAEKDICVGKLLTRKFERITEELDKCELLCANCHRIEHAQY